MVKLVSKSSFFHRAPKYASLTGVGPAAGQFLKILLFPQGTITRVFLRIQVKIKTVRMGLLDLVEETITGVELPTIGASLK